MATAVATNRLFISDSEAALAEQLLTQLDDPQAFLAVSTDECVQTISPQLATLIQQILESAARGSTVTVSTVPAELTTVTAASLIGVSRPTLMKMISEGRLPAHKVGSHTKLNSSDVFEFIKQRQEEQRVAFDRLRDLLD